MVIWHFNLSKCIGKLNEKWSLVQTMPQGKKQLTLDFPVKTNTNQFEHTSMARLPDCYDC